MNTENGVKIVWIKVKSWLVSSVSEAIRRIKFVVVFRFRKFLNATMTVLKAPYEFFTTGKNPFRDKARDSLTLAQREMYDRIKDLHRNPPPLTREEQQAEDEEYDRVHGTFYTNYIAPAWQDLCESTWGLYLYCHKAPLTRSILNFVLRFLLLPFRILALILPNNLSREILYTFLMHIQFYVKHPLYYPLDKLYQHWELRSSMGEPHALDVLGDSILNTYMSYGIKMHEVNQFTLFREEFLLNVYTQNIFIGDPHILVSISNKRVLENIWTLLCYLRDNRGRKAVGLARSEIASLFLSSLHHFMVDRFRPRDLLKFPLKLVFFLFSLLFFLLFWCPFMLLHRFVLTHLISISFSAVGLISTFFWELVYSISFFISLAKGLFDLSKNFVYFCLAFPSLPKNFSYQDMEDILVDGNSVSKPLLARILGRVAGRIYFRLLLPIANYFMSYIPPRNFAWAMMRYITFFWVWDTQKPLLPNNVEFMWSQDFFFEPGGKFKDYKYLYQWEGFVESVFNQQFWVTGGLEVNFYTGIVNTFGIFNDQMDGYEDEDDDYEAIDFMVMEVHTDYTASCISLGRGVQDYLVQFLYNHRYLGVLLPPFITLFSYPWKSVHNGVARTSMLLRKYTLNRAWKHFRALFKIGFGLLSFTFLVFVLVRCYVCHIRFSLCDMFILLHGLIFSAMLVGSERKYRDDVEDKFPTRDEAFFDLYWEHTEEEYFPDDFYDLHLSSAYMVPSFIGFVSPDFLVGASTMFNSDYKSWNRIFYQDLYHDVLDNFVRVWCDSFADLWGWLTHFVH